MRLTLLTIFTVIWGTWALADIAERQITVSGQGQVAARPDMARIVVGVEVTARTAMQALSENSERVSALIDVLSAADIPERDIQTRQLSLNPRWERRNDNTRPPAIVGYTAQNTLELRIRKIATLGEILDQLTKSGANRIDSISFEISNPAPLLKEARLAAVNDARDKAELLSGAAGAELGQVLFINEAGNPSRPQFRAAARMEAAMAVPVAEGEVSLSANVTITYALD